MHHLKGKALDFLSVNSKEFQCLCSALSLRIESPLYNKDYFQMMNKVGQE